MTASTLRWFFIAVSVLDGLAGAGLLLVPEFTLRSMGALVPGDEALLYVRFVGAFVFATGAAYLLAAREPKRERLAVFLQATTLLRLATGLFCAVAVATGALKSAWLMVAFADFIIAVVQVRELQKENLGHE